MERGIVAFAVEECGGFSFNGRALSKDRLMMADLQKRVAPSSIINIDSEADLNSLSETFNSCKRSDISSSEELIIFTSVVLPEKVREKFFMLDKWDYYLYRWNRSYPADQYFLEDLDGKWSLLQKEDFEGSSHLKITFELWRMNIDE